VPEVLISLAATPSSFRAAPARRLELLISDWLVTHYGRYVTIAATTFQNPFAALVTGLSG
jgi:hypothetical protein